MSRACAVKENLDSSPQAQQQFEREAKILANLNHPNLARVTDYFFVPGQGQYLVMDYVEGEDLQEMLDQAGGPLAEAQVFPWVNQVCDALEYLHTQQPPVIHRDIKPANIRITPGGKAVLVDFSIAKIYDPNLKTTQGARAVTPGYSPQEQYGQGHTDVRSDIYALGATLYALLTGQIPVESIQRNLNVTFPTVRALNPAVSAATERAILQAMEMLPANRYQNVHQLKLALLGSGPTFHVMNQQVVAGATGARKTLPQTEVWPADIRKLLLLGVVVLALGVGGALIVWYFRTHGGGHGGTPIAQATLTNAATSEPQRSPTATSTLRPTHTIAPTDTPQPETPPGLTQVSPVDGMAMVYIPAGEFLMGSTLADIQQMKEICPKCPDNYFSDQLPQHKVYLDAYWIDLTEVTNDQFADFLSHTGYRTTAEQKGSSYVMARGFSDFQYIQGADWISPAGPGSNIIGNGKAAVTQVSWDDAAAYCQWAERRLPTEAEWEKAARGTDGRFFPWGNQVPDDQLLSFNYNALGPVVVGNYSAGASPYGLLDMAGNVWEWVSDFYSETYYQVSPDHNPQGPNRGDGHTFRGGSWASELNTGMVFVTTTFRLWNKPFIRSNVLGIRCAMDAGP